MLIDGFTVIAQIVNFLILVWLLNRFLFKPVRRALAEREKRMADALDQARQMESQARAAAAALEREQAALAQERQRLMAEARDQVAGWRQGALNEAREEVEALRQGWVAHMNQERQAFLDRLKRHLVEQVARIGEKALRDLADQPLNRQVVRVFLERVAAGREAFHPGQFGQEMVVGSGFPLEEAQMRHLRQALGRYFPLAAGIRFESRPQLGLGIELVVGDRKVGWHLADYLQELEGQIVEQLIRDPRERA